MLLRKEFLEGGTNCFCMPKMVKKGYRDVPCVMLLKQNVSSPDAEVKFYNEITEDATK